MLENFNLVTLFFAQKLFEIGGPKEIGKIGTFRCVRVRRFDGLEKILGQQCVIKRRQTSCFKGELFPMIEQDQWSLVGDFIHLAGFFIQPERKFRP